METGRKVQKAVMSLAGKYRWMGCLSVWQVNVMLKRVMHMKNIQTVSKEEDAENIVYPDQSKE